MKKNLVLVCNRSAPWLDDALADAFPECRVHRCRPSGLKALLAEGEAVLVDAGLGVVLIADLLDTAQGLPVLVLDEEDDAAYGESLLEAGAAEYVAVAAAGPERLRRAVADAIARERGRSAAWRRLDLLGRMFSIVSRKELSVAEQIDRILEAGCNLFELDDGTLAYVESGFYVIEHAYSRDGSVRPGEQWLLSETYCERTLEAGVATAIEDSGAEPGRPHPAVIRGQRSYLGVPVVVADQVYGTLAFTGSARRERLVSGAEKALLATLSDWLGSLLTRAQMLGELKLLATYDALTSLPNRRAFLGKLDRSIEHCRHTDRNPFALLFIDLDGFKAVNDRAGHLAGDDLLAAVARRLESILLPKDIIARYAGDEFAILLEDVDIDQAEMVALRIRKAFEQAFVLPSCEAEVGASIGVAMHEGHLDSDELIKRADAAMYRAKRSGAGVCRA